MCWGSSSNTDHGLAVIAFNSASLSALGNIKSKYFVPANGLSAVVPRLAVAKLLSVPEISHVPVDVSVSFASVVPFIEIKTRHL